MLKFKHDRILLLIVITIVVTSVCAQPVDTAYNTEIRKHTTDTRFLPNVVLDLVDHPAIPSPRKHFGQIIGAPGVMHHTEEIFGYYKKLAETSPLLR